MMVYNKLSKFLNTMSKCRLFSLHSEEFRFWNPQCYAQYPLSVKRENDSKCQGDLCKETEHLCARNRNQVRILTKTNNQYILCNSQKKKTNEKLNKGRPS